MKINALLERIALGLCSLLISSSLWIGTAQAQDGDPEAGKYLFSTCSGCHAIPGYSNAYPTYHVPRIAGQHPEYIVIALNAYKNQQRNHPSMYANAATLSDQQMADIAAYLGSFELDGSIGPVRGDPSKGEEKAATCAACHGVDGNSQNPIWPRLSGQYEDYLIQSLKAYRSGERENAVMYGIAAALSDEDIADLAAWYASQQPALDVVSYDID